MDSNRRTALSAGALFITATVTILLATPLSQPLLNDANYLVKLSANVNQVTLGVLLELIAAGTSAGIAISLYPVLKRWNVSLALGSVVFRAMEAVMYTVGAVNLLSVLTLGQHFASAGAADRASLQALGDSLLATREHAILAGVFAFSVGALMYYYVFYQSRLIPRWLSGWGIAAIILTMSACLFALFGHQPVTSYTLLVLPIAVQEMVLAVWLIVKGFSSAPLQSITAFNDSIPTIEAQSFVPSRGSVASSERTR